MSRITMDLLRKRSEHNDCEITTLEELSLHQQDLVKIELLDTACRDLKILLLQNNLIGKIENVKRLKLLDYLNLALNNIKVIEGLETCEMLRKLDLTVNFVADLASVESLAACRELRELYLTGNPCSMYEGYREFVVATLPQLDQLDGIKITRSERIVATQDLAETRRKVLEQSRGELQKEAARLAKLARRAAKEAEIKARREANGGAGSDWYTNPNSRGSHRGPEPKIVELDSDGEGGDYSDDSLDELDISPEAEKAYWEEEGEFTPESRVEAALHSARVKEKEEFMKTGNRPGKKKKTKPRNFFKADGQAYNMNDAGLDFCLEGQYDNTEPLVLDLGTYKYLDTSQLDVDVQVRYVRVTFKGKVFQLALPDEVKPDSSKAARSKITGHLMVTMPKESQQPKPKPKPKKADPETLIKNELLDGGGDENAPRIDYSQIMQDAAAKKAAFRTQKAPSRANDDDFVDDDDVPPLE